VGEDKSGVASGINNAVSRTASLLAIAIFGVVMLHAFSRNLSYSLARTEASEDVRQSIYEQRVKLAGMELPSNLDSKVRAQAEEAIAGSFVSGFRLIMFISAVLALGGAVSSWLIISPERPDDRGMHTS
jgi:hypothetical protein